MLQTKRGPDWLGEIPSLTELRAGIPKKTHSPRKFRPPDFNFVLKEIQILYEISTRGGCGKDFRALGYTLIVLNQMEANSNDLQFVILGVCHTVISRGSGEYSKLNIHLARFGLLRLRSQ
ncbi:hypothetical protein VNO77_18963 [Canavalia gladiata]|uniref:Uncharacterized protein n=1 Tax=Canavalia gladiata TaxID=3824 RepID=A0AAN9LLV9_CANGL